MDIEEIKALKKETEKRIRDQVVNFCNQTGLAVESIDFEVISVQDMGGINKTTMTGLTMKVEV